MGGRINPDTGLTAKQEKFVEVYVETENATEAARHACDLGSRGGSSDVTPRVVGHELRTNPNVAAAIERKRAEMRRLLSPEHIVERIDRLSSKAEDAAEYGPALRGAELLGRAAGLFDAAEDGKGGQIVINIERA